MTMPSDAPISSAGVPVGTAIGGLTIYFLLQDDVKSAFATD